jgi:alcohol dehydrogenase (cytochrome c)
MTRRTTSVLLIALTCVAALAVAVVGVKPLRWRVELLALHAAGKIPDIGFGELVSMMKPGSGQWLEGMVENRSPHETVVNPRRAEEDARRGAEIFIGTCAGCHGADGHGTDTAPALAGRALKVGSTPWSLYRTIRHGVPGTSMPAHDRPDHEIWQLVTHVMRLNGATPVPAATPGLAAAIDVPFEAIRDARDPAGDWLTYSGSWSGARHSALASIRPDNVRMLQPRWIHQLEGKYSRLETSPIVRDGVMYVSVPPLRILALDASSGDVLWTFDEKVPADIRPACCDGGPVNRGVAILGDKVFIGTPDARIIALSARTGRKLWDTRFADYRLGYSVTGAPLAIRDLVVVGVGSGDFATRCFIVAFDAETGTERWRFDTIPGPGEPGHETWAGDTWKTGGTASWMTGSYDPDLDLVYWGIGNAAPNFNASLRNGANLYSNSVVALEGRTGKLAWHFQFTPADAHDWDSTQIPILADREAGGGLRKLLLFANRNAFFYRLDRERGDFLSGTAYAKQNWADGLTSAGAPLARESATPTRAGVAVWPGPGATNWWSPSYDAKRGLVFIPVHQKGLIFLAYEQDDPAPGEPNLEGGVKDIPHGEALWTVRALRADTGELVWEHRLDAETLEPGTGGLMSTASGLLFGGHQKRFFALDSATGRELWSFPVGKAINAAPVSYLAHDEQYVAIAAGRLVVAFGLPSGGRPSLADAE